QPDLRVSHLSRPWRAPRVWHRLGRSTAQSLARRLRGGYARHPRRQESEWLVSGTKADGGGNGGSVHNGIGVRRISRKAKRFHHARQARRHGFAQRRYFLDRPREDSRCHGAEDVRRGETRVGRKPFRRRRTLESLISAPSFAVLVRARQGPSKLVKAP